MEKIIFAPCDLHDKNMLLRIAVDREAPVTRVFENDSTGRATMIAELRERARKAGAARIVFAYETSGLGFGLYDELTAEGIACHVLATSRMTPSPKQRRSKTDAKDATRILEVLRGHYLAGNELPDVWIPGEQIRDDREPVRARLDAQEKCTQLKEQIVTLLKRNHVEKPAGLGGNWTKKHRAWLIKMRDCTVPLRSGARTHLASLLRQLAAMEGEVDALNGAVAELAAAERYVQRVTLLQKIKSVGILTALVFLTEMGDLERFKNRKQVGSYVGLTPSSDESGETDDRKGHITRQGSARIRFVLNQAVWNILRFDPGEREVYERIAAKNPQHKKIAVVALMRRLAIRMWHAARAAA